MLYSVRFVTMAKDSLFCVGRKKSTVIDPFTDASLQNLAVSTGELTPAFKSNVYDYTVSLPHNVAEITITATPSNAKATVTGAGLKTLNVGENPFSIVVTAENGVTTQEYRIVVTRAGIGITETALTDIIVYPNPTTGLLTINNEQLTMNNVEVFDMKGNSVYSLFITHCSLFITIDISHLPAGIYFLRVDDKVVKVIKN